MCGRLLPLLLNPKMANTNRSSRSKTAWLVTWDDVLSPDLPIPTSRVVCLLSARLHESSVKLILSYVWSAVYSLTIGEKMAFATESEWRDKFCITDRSPASDDGFLYGTKPYLYARKVTGVRVEQDLPAGTETIYWQEPDRYEFINGTTDCRLALKGRERSFTQDLNPK